MQYPIISRGARLMSAKLQDESGQEIGEVVEWLMDVQRGCVVFVVAEFYNSPGFYPIPWPLLTALPEAGAFTVDRDLVQRPELFINHHELTEMIEDWALMEKIFRSHHLGLDTREKTFLRSFPHGKEDLDRSARLTPSGEWMWIEKSAHPADGKVIHG